jgi:ABC-type dipeptide/oligopeptide/nickel transport system permease subunit
MSGRSRRPSRDLVILGAFACFIVLIAVLGTWPPHSTVLPSGNPFEGPEAGHLAGTDAVGRDMLARILVGARLSLAAGAAVVVASIILGGLIGLVAGFFGGIVDTILMRFTDLFLALPAPLLAIAVAGAFGRAFWITLVAVTVVWWPLYARIVRGEARAIMTRPHIKAARLAGRGRTSMLFLHVLPGTMSPVIVAASMDLGLTIITLSGLSFLGLGSPEPFPELGAMTSQNLGYLLNSWWLPILPAVMLFVITYTANIAGDALRDFVQER